MNDKVSPPAAPITVYNDLFGGHGQVRVWSMLHGEMEPFTAALACELAPGGSVGAHVQQEFPELVIGVGGAGEARVNGVAHALDAFHAVHLPHGATLQIVNRSQHEPLRYLIIKARGR